VSTVAIPSYSAFLFPILEVLDQATGSLSKREMDAAVIERLGLTDEQLAVSYPDGSKARGSKILHRIAFARSSLKLFSAIDNSQRSVWAITPTGRALLEHGEEAVRRADSDMRRQLARERNERQGADPRPVDATSELDDDEQPAVVVAAASEDSTTWQQDLLSQLMAMTPRAFERLCAQILREAGCEEVEVTQYVGDEGLDGVGLLRMGLLTFPVYFQAKRYAGTVGPEKVRELRGALFGRADKGILITTGRFSSAAMKEAARAGAPIDLIDGERLCDLLLEYRLGVTVRPVVDTAALARFEN
jgi:restriction system protein